MKNLLPLWMCVRSYRHTFIGAFYFMSKDPAVLFYTQDFLVGTTFMNHEQRGKYITLLCLQHQKGVLSEKDMLHICGTYDEDVFAKFVRDDQGNFFNERMKMETERRATYAESRRKNRMKKETYEKDMLNTSKTYVRHMENENETENVIVIENNTVTNKGPKNRIDELFEHIWIAYGKKGTKQTALAKFRKLSKDDMKAIMGHVEQYVQNHKDNGKLEFLPHFTTYINQRRWMDELPYTKKQGWDDIDWNAPQKGWFE